MLNYHQGLFALSLFVTIWDVDRRSVVTTATATRNMLESAAGDPVHSRAYAAVMPPDFRASVPAGLGGDPHLHEIIQVDSLAVR